MSVLSTLYKTVRSQYKKPAELSGENLISRDYARLNQALHASSPQYGTSGKQWAKKVVQLANSVGAHSILDYGCGKQTLAKALPDWGIIGYDPAVPGLDAPPTPADMVVCTDVLEHVEPDCIGGVLDHIQSLAQKIAFVTVATRPAVKTLADGRNAHLTVQPFEWWKENFEARFQISEVKEIEGYEFSLVLLPLNATDKPLPMEEADELAAKALKAAPPASSPVSMDVDYKGLKISFATPNEMTAWRVSSFFKKEPDTVRWLEGLPQGAVMLDVGANVGMYSLFAGKARGVRVIAFEPESQNYATLNRNISLNKMDGLVTAFPLAISDGMRADKLYLSSFDTGGSCHSFGEQVGFDLKPRKHAFEQGAFSISLDQLVEMGQIPVPDYIKIDVDGIEHKVLQGARGIIGNPKLKSIIVELNTNLEEHRDIVELLESHGFQYDVRQVDGALRKSGTFKGVGEFIFSRKAATAGLEIDFQREFKVSPPLSSEGRRVLSHMIKRVGEVATIQEPFPYLVVDDIFPPDYYQKMLMNFPSEEVLRPIGETGRVTLRDLYKERRIALFSDEDFAKFTETQQSFWREFSDWMYSDLFMSTFIGKFQAELEPRLNAILKSGEGLSIRSDGLLVSDKTDYAIGPHTDSPARLISFLFYMPADDGMRELGTSVYRPRDPDFVCWGGPHHDGKEFEVVKTVEFLPNRLLAFPKTERSFHGVEKITRADIDRRLVINNVRLLNKITH